MHVCISTRALGQWFCPCNLLRHPSSTWHSGTFLLLHCDVTMVSFFFLCSWPWAERRGAYGCVRFPHFHQRQLAAHWTHEEGTPWSAHFHSGAFHGKCTLLNDGQDNLLQLIHRVRSHPSYHAKKKKKQSNKLLPSFATALPPWRASVYRTTQSLPLESECNYCHLQEWFCLLNGSISQPGCHGTCERIS